MGKPDVGGSEARPGKAGPESRTAERTAMLGFFARLLFTSTAIAPVAFVYAYALYMEGRPSTALKVALAALALVLIATVFLVWVLGYLGKSNVRLTSAEIADRENISFLLLYISPLFTGDIDDLNFSIALPVVALFLVVIMIGNNYHFNPLLNILGWHFYKVDTADAVSRVLITRRSLRNVVNTLQVVQLSDYVIMEVK
jgi:hypothetical protein